MKKGTRYNLANVRTSSHPLLCLPGGVLLRPQGFRTAV
jgi:hypothetical protein